MPQLICKGLTHDEVATLSQHLGQTLASLSQTPEDYFTFEAPQTTYFRHGQPHAMYPLIEVLLFDRGHEVEQQMATAIASAVKNLGHQTCEVYFMHIGHKDYYEF